MTQDSKECETRRAIARAQDQSGNVKSLVCYALRDTLAHKDKYIAHIARCRNRPACPHGEVRRKWRPPAESASALAAERLERPAEDNRRRAMLLSCESPRCFLFQPPPRCDHVTGPRRIPAAPEELSLSSDSLRSLQEARCGFCNVCLLLMLIPSLRARPLHCGSLDKELFEGCYSVPRGSVTLGGGA